MLSEDILFLSVTELAKRIQSRKLSPGELTQSYLDRSQSIGKKLEAAGAVLLGKAAMIELAGGMGYRFASASATGAAKNPWNTDYWTCGSSSGSGAIMG